MLIRTVITAAALMGLGLVGRTQGAESEPPPPPRGQAFERLDQNHDGVIQREEFDQARGRRVEQQQQERGDRGSRGDRGRRGPRGGDEPRGIFRDGGSCERRIDDAIDRAMKRAEGNPEELRRALHDELSQVIQKRRGSPGPADAPLTAPDAERWDRRRGAPRDGEQPSPREREFGKRGGPPRPRGGEGLRDGRRGRGPGREEGAGRHRRNPEARAARIMDRLDGNDDGVLAAEEMEGRRAERWLRADADGDGRVDRAELLTMLREAGERDGRIGRRGPKEPEAPPPPPED